MSAAVLRKPHWIRSVLPPESALGRMRGVLETCRLSTVCEEARCPNRGDCWSRGTATFMILGAVCTRSCRFCAVASAPQGEPLRPDEGGGILRAAEELDLRHLVITSVDRDDLEDRGAGHFAAIIRLLKERLPGVPVEVLIPDYDDEEIRRIAAARPDVIAHNVETPRSLQGVRDRRASFDRSLGTLRSAKARGFLTKTSLLLGLGEGEAEIYAALDELRSAAVDMLVMGQYLRPSPRQIPVKEYLPPEQFDRYAQAARDRGFSSVIASPLARTSYKAGEGYAQVSREAGHAV